MMLSNTVEEIGAAGKADAEPGWKFVFTERKQKEYKNQKNKPTHKTVKNDSAQKRLMTGGFSGNELLSCTRRIFRAPGKMETAHICARGVERRTQCMCLNPCHKSMSA